MLRTRCPGKFGHCARLRRPLVREREAEEEVREKFIFVIGMTGLQSRPRAVQQLTRATTRAGHRAIEVYLGSVDVEALYCVRKRDLCRFEALLTGNVIASNFEMSLTDMNV